MRNYIKRAAELPKDEHWAILSFGSVHIPGDERSRTNPGHGYPAHDAPKLDYIAFSTWAECEAELAKMGPGAVAIHVTETFGVVSSVKVQRHGATEGTKGR